MLVLALGALVPAVSRADAVTYCVHQAGFTCPVGTVDEGINLQTALDQATNNPSTASSPNVITIGPGTYQPSSAGSGFSATTQYPLQVTGAGVGQTTLTDSATQAVIQVVGTSGPNTVSVSGLTVGGAGQYGVFISNGSVDHVAVDPSGPGSSTEDGVLLADSTVKDSTVTFQAGDSGAGLLISGSGGITSNEIDDVTVDGGNYGVDATAGGTIHRAKLIGNTIPLEVDSAPVYIDDSLLVGGGLRAEDDQNTEGSIQAVSDTIVTGSSSGTGVMSASNSSSGTDITIYNSIIHGFPTSFETAGTNATIEAANDNYDGTTGAGISVRRTVTGDPAFVDAGAGDYHLAWNSPLIDAGNTSLENGASTTDLDGNPREVPPFTGSTSPLDLGAYEYQHQAPTAVASDTPSSVMTGTPITFDGSRSSDPADGDTLTYAWSFDDGATGTGASVTHSFSTPGVHTATLTVTDPTGLTSRQLTTVTVTSPPTPTPTPTATTQPTPLSGTVTNPAPPHLTVLGKLVVTGNKVTLKLACTGTAACSRIDVTETTVEKQKTRKRIVRVASAALRLNPGQTKSVTLTLNGTGNAMLKRFATLPITITVTMTTARTTATVKAAHATLRPPTKPPHGHP
jgi:PKD domain